MFGNNAEKRIAREADKVTSLKEDLDALSWGRVMDIGRQLQIGQDAQTIASLGAELAAIAQTNISLALRLGIDPEPPESRMMASGMEVFEGGFAEAALATVQITDAATCCSAADTVARDGQTDEEESFEPQEPSDALLFCSESELPIVSACSFAVDEPVSQAAAGEEPEAEVSECLDAADQPMHQCETDNKIREGDRCVVISSKGHCGDSFARFRSLYESRDGSLCVFEDDRGHLVAVDSSKLA